MQFQFHSSGRKCTAQAQPNQFIAKKNGGCFSTGARKVLYFSLNKSHSSFLGLYGRLVEMETRTAVETTHSQNRKIIITERGRT
jgi:hypothetical protein